LKKSLPSKDFFINRSTNQTSGNPLHVFTSDICVAIQNEIILFNLHRKSVSSWKKDNLGRKKGLGEEVQVPPSRNTIYAITVVEFCCAGFFFVPTGLKRCSVHEA